MDNKVNADAHLKIDLVGVLEDKDHGVFAVVLSESPPESARRIELQRSLADDRETYCIATSWGPVQYGGVVSAALKDNILTLTFRPDAAQVLDVPSELVMELNVDADSRNDLSVGLRRVFADSEPSVRLEI